MAPINPKDWDDISVTVDGKSVDLEDAFDIFEEVFEDAEKAFEHMDKTFQMVDKNIGDKLNKLKIKLASKRPEKYEYVPESESDLSEDAKWEQHMRTQMRLKRKSKAFRNLTLMFVLIACFFGFGAVFLTLTMDKEPEFGSPPKMEQQTKAPEKLEKL